MLHIIPTLRGLAVSVISLLTSGEGTLLSLPFAFLVMYCLSHMHGGVL